MRDRLDCVEGFWKRSHFQLRLLIEGERRSGPDPYAVLHGDARKNHMAAACIAYYELGEGYFRQSCVLEFRDLAKFSPSR